MLIDETKTLFPLEDYPQAFDQWNLEDDQKIIFTEKEQAEHYQQLLKIYYGEAPEDPSPWNPIYIQFLLDQQNVQTTFQDFISLFTDDDQTRLYGENFRLLTQSWKHEMRKFASLPINLSFLPECCAISVETTPIRLLPTALPVFKNLGIAGEGYPFDLLQNSSVHPAEPVYIVTQTQDKSWSFVVTTSAMGWVETTHLAEADQNFITAWKALAKNRCCAAIKNDVSVIDQFNVFRFKAKIGTFLPELFENETKKIAIAVKNQQGKASIHYAAWNKNQWKTLPLLASKSNLFKLLHSMLGKTYGWGNLNDLNDCSSEMKNFFLPLGIYLPRNSLEQAHSHSHSQLDLSNVPTNERINTLLQKGLPLRTLIYINGHIMLYLGKSSWNEKTVPLTYQNIWALKSKDSKSRSIIGKSILLPLLTEYPKAEGYVSLASQPLFKLIFL